MNHYCYHHLISSVSINGICFFIPAPVSYTVSSKNSYDGKKYSQEKYAFRKIIVKNIVEKTVSLSNNGCCFLLVNRLLPSISTLNISSSR